MAKEGGIIDKDINPFYDKDWVKQGRRLTGKRQDYLIKIFNKTVEEIKEINRNEGKYPAFVAIRWGFAEIKNNVLVKTQKWENKHSYDEYGDSLSLNKAPDSSHKSIPNQEIGLTKKSTFSEKDMEDAVAANPEIFIGAKALQSMPKFYFWNVIFRNNDSFFNIKI